MGYDDNRDKTVFIAKSFLADHANADTPRAENSGNVSKDAWLIPHGQAQVVGTRNFRYGTQWQLS
jgi:hypothetical protein